MSSGTFQMGDFEGKVQYVSQDDPEAIKAAEFAASKSNPQVDFFGIKSAFKIAFEGSKEVYYFLVFWAKDLKVNGGEFKLYFTVVKGFPDPVVLLCTPIITDVGMGGGNGKEQPFPPNTADGKVLAFKEDDKIAVQAAKFAAAQNGVDFLAPNYCTGFKIIFEGKDPAFSSLVFEGKDCTGELKFYFTMTMFPENRHHLVLRFKTLDHLSAVTPAPIDAEGKVEIINETWIKEAQEVVKFVAIKYGLKHPVIILGFKIFFPSLPPSVHQPYYYLMFSAEDRKGVKREYFTIVVDKNSTPDAVLLIEPDPDVKVVPSLKVCPSKVGG